MTGFKIYKVTNHRGNPKVSPTVKARLGRVIDWDASKIELGKPGFFVCISPGFEDSLMTSRISHIYFNGDIISIWTANSIYWLEKENKSQMSEA